MPELYAKVLNIVMEHKQDGGMDDTLYDQLEQAMGEAENARRDTYQETIRRGKAEKSAIDAIRRVTVLLLSASYSSCNV